MSYWEAASGARTVRRAGDVVGEGLRGVAGVVPPHEGVQGTKHQRGCEKGDIGLPCAVGACMVRQGPRTRVGHVHKL